MSNDIFSSKQLAARNPAPGKAVRMTKRVTDAQKQRFLEALAQTGIFAAAARQASPHTKTGGARSYRRLMENDPLFAGQVAEAMDRAHGAIVLEARRRALTGDLVPVYQKGERVLEHDGSPASIRRYSDSLLLRLLNHVPGFEPVNKIEHEHKGVVHHSNSFVIDLDALVLLDQSDRDALRRIAAKIDHIGGSDQKQIAPPVIDADYSEVDQQDPEEWMTIDGSQA